jgi:nucleoside 2-deoxyribosyltransferase
MKKIYLAGLISTDYPASLEWRDKITPYLEGAGFEVLSPMRGKKAFKLVNGGLVDPNLSSKDIITRDYHDVEGSDVILMHLDGFGSPRPLLGTICEMAWAWQLKKPVVAIAAEDNTLMRLHPFVKETVSHYFTTVEDAASFAANYYGG